MLWNTIINLPGCTPLTLRRPFAAMFLFETPEDDTHWMVGPYNDLTKIASALREDRGLRDVLTENRVRLGLRETDIPPADVKRKKRYGRLVKGDNPRKNYSSRRRDPLAPPVDPEEPEPINRRGDREKNVKDYWDTQTPQSHHIVEFNNLKTLGVSHSVGVAEMDYLQLPAVLLAAEFHQRYYSAILKPAQRLGKKQLRTQIVGVYQELYDERSPLFEPLWEISKVILTEAGLEVT